jgi:phosphoribosylanthranilate isomerase
MADAPRWTPTPTPAPAPAPAPTLTPASVPTFLIKICGVTSAEDAAFAVSAGAGAIGVNLWPASKRFVGAASAARRVLAAVPRGVLRVGVFVDAAPEEVERAMRDLDLDRVQLHGSETAGAFAALPRAALIRAVRVRDDASFADEDAWRAGLYLYDAFVAGFGGGGVTAPWELIARRAARPFLLAGGLTPENVAGAISLTRADGVDVASGVEHGPGRKDPAKVVAFIQAARAAAAARP